MDNKKISTSIARKINMQFWLKRLCGVLSLDMMLVLLFLMWNHMYEFGIPYQSLAIPAILLGIFEVVYLFTALFETGGIRRKLKPLNDLAVKAEKLSSFSLDSVKFQSLEHEIERISPLSLETGIHTGDKDLQSIEIALNNLLARIRESQRQQARFVSDASHELRTPIAVIQGYVNMLDRWGKQDETVLNESIEALKNESMHMKELVEQLLFLARGDSGRNHLNKTEFDCNDMMREVYEEAVMIDTQHRYLYKECDAAPVFGDIAMLKQSARIFVQNAAKYTKEGGEILLSTVTDSQYTAYIVQDSGIGINSDEISHIFERFYRADEARGTQTGGSGLGLSIAKWIIDAHDGSIEVLSGPDIGTRFTVKIPK